MSTDTAAGRWNELDSKRQSLLTRCEKYSALTIPSICPPLGYDEDSDELQHDYQSLGAQAVNHLSNKLMLALFAPSRPFFRLDISERLEAQMAELGMSLEELSAQFAVAESKAIRELDRRPIRPKLYDGTKHLLVTGNCMLVFGRETLRVLGIKKYVVERDVDGVVLEMLTREDMHPSSLEPKARAELGEYKDDGPNCQVSLYRWIKRDENGDYRMSQWVNDHRLSEEFDGKWPWETLPYRPITWELASGNNYGTGLVENYAGDLTALSLMSRATVQAAILASEFRWLVNPAGMTSPDDFEKSDNGAALPGVAGDVTLIQSNKGADLSVNLNIAQTYIQRIGQGFLLQSAVTRQAERVTAEEVRRTAEELETSLGGAYSRIAIDLQAPMVPWLMDMTGRKIRGTDVEPVIVTGLAALSRHGDRENLMLFLQDCALLSQLPPDLLGRVKVGEVQSAFAAARGLDTRKYLLSEEEFKKKQEAMMKQQMAMELANRMPIASPEGVNASQALVAGQAAEAAIAAHRSQP